MRQMLERLMCAVALATLFMAAQLASAKAEIIEGVIKGLNTDIGAIILTDGTQIMLPAEFNVVGLDPGKKIYVDYDIVDGNKIAQIIEVIEE